MALGILELGSRASPWLAAQLGPEVAALQREKEAQAAELAAAAKQLQDVRVRGRQELPQSTTRTVRCHGVPERLHCVCSRIGRQIIEMHEGGSHLFKDTLLRVWRQGVFSFPVRDFILIEFYGCF